MLKKPAAKSFLVNFKARNFLGVEKSIHLLLLVHGYEPCSIHGNNATESSIFQTEHKLDVNMNRSMTYFSSIWTLKKFLENRFPNILMLIRSQPFTYIKIFENLFSRNIYVQIDENFVMNAFIFSASDIHFSPIRWSDNIS